MTEFSKIIQSFLSLTPKNELAFLDDETLEENAKFWIRDAVSRFAKFCRKDLYDADYDLQVFYEDLDIEEIQILARAMRLSFYESDIIGIDALSTLNSRDYKEYSNANAVRSGMAVKVSLEEELTQAFSRYTYNPRSQGFRESMEGSKNVQRPR